MPERPVVPAGRVRGRHRLSARPRIQRCFLAWAEEVRPRLAFPLRRLSRTDRALNCTLDGVPAALTVVLADDIMVWVEWEGEGWDAIFWNFVDVGSVPGGRTCTACPPDERQVWPDREALWREHLFEPLLEWINGPFAQADDVALYGRKGGSTHAQLRPSSDGRLCQTAEPYAVILLRTSPGVRPVLSVGSADPSPE